MVPMGRLHLTNRNAQDQAQHQQKGRSIGQILTPGGY